jgi:hypothetical protein
MGDVIGNGKRKFQRSYFIPSKLGTWRLTEVHSEIMHVTLHRMRST